MRTLRREEWRHVPMTEHGRARNELLVGFTLDIRASTWQDLRDEACSRHGKPRSPGLPQEKLGGLVRWQQLTLGVRELCARAGRRAVKLWSPLAPSSSHLRKDKRHLGGTFRRLRLVSAESTIGRALGRLGIACRASGATAVATARGTEQSDIAQMSDVKVGGHLTSVPVIFRGFMYLPPPSTTHRASRRVACPSHVTRRRIRRLTREL